MEVWKDTRKSEMQEVIASVMEAVEGDALGGFEPDPARAAACCALLRHSAGYSDMIVREGPIWSQPQKLQRRSACPPSAKSQSQSPTLIGRLRITAIPLD